MNFYACAKPLKCRYMTGCRPRFALNRAPTLHYVVNNRPFCDFLGRIIASQASFGTCGRKTTLRSRFIHGYWIYARLYQKSIYQAHARNPTFGQLLGRVWAHKTEHFSMRSVYNIFTQTSMQFVPEPYSLVSKVQWVITAGGQTRWIVVS